MENFTPVQRINIFLWEIYNIIRNLNILKHWLKINYTKKVPLEDTSGKILVKEKKLGLLNSNQEWNKEDL